ncbi:Uncharacterised protein [Mycobacteroides abscessus subsp. abscessus]|nr:Uncharacterised protein [Mycobacteroides abscessus subsp. abscessus]
MTGWVPVASIADAPAKVWRTMSSAWARVSPSATALSIMDSATMNK